MHALLALMKNFENGGEEGGKGGGKSYKPTESGAAVGIWGMFSKVSLLGWGKESCLLRAWRRFLGTEVIVKRPDGWIMGRIGRKRVLRIGFKDGQG